MSLGWQTESALLPKQAKSIQVDSKSILSLKSLIYEKEQQLQSKNGHTGVRNRSTLQTNKSKEKDVFLRKNKGIEDRMHRDELKLDKNKNNDDSNLIQASLIAKAKIYDDLKNNRILQDSKAKEQFLIDFDNNLKRETHRKLDEENEVISSFDTNKMTPTQPVTQNDVKEIENNQNDTYVEIVDNFGRTRRVSKRSSEYADYHMAETAKKFKKTQPVESDSEDDHKKGPYAWSTGKNREDTEDWIEDTIRSHGVKSLIEDRIDDEIKQLSKGSKIQTMWEKTLDSSAKVHLNDIHKSVEDYRKVDKQQEKSQDGNNSRKELLRKKLLEKKQSN